VVQCNAMLYVVSTHGRHGLAAVYCRVYTVECTAVALPSANLLSSSQ